MKRGGLLSLLLRRNGLLIVAFTAAGLLQWAFIKLVALNQPADEFGRFVALLHFVMILTTPLVSLQGAISRQVASLIASGRRDSVLPYLHRRLRSWLAPIGVVGAIVLLTAWPLASALDLGSPLALVLLTAILLAYLPFQACLGALAGSERFGPLAGLLVLDTGLRCLIALAFPGHVDTTVGALGASLTALVAALVVGLVLVHRGQGASKARRDPDESLTRALPAFLTGAIAFSVLAYQDALLVRLVLSPEDAGRYAAAVAISRLLLVLVYPMIPTMVPLVARRHAEGRPTRRVLLFHVFLVSGPVTVAVLAGVFVPDVVGSILLDPEKHSGLGGLLALAFAVASLLVVANLSMHYLLALHRVAVVPVLLAAAVAGALLILTSPPEPSIILVRLTWLAGAVCAATTIMALAGCRGNRLRSSGPRPPTACS